MPDETIGERLYLVSFAFGCAIVCDKCGVEAPSLTSAEDNADECYIQQARIMELAGWSPGEATYLGAFCRPCAPNSA